MWWCAISAQKGGTMKKLVLMSVMLLLAAAVVVRHQPAAQVKYVPQAGLCADTTITTLCSKLLVYWLPQLR